MNVQVSRRSSQAHREGKGSKVQKVAGNEQADSDLPGPNLSDRRHTATLLLFQRQSLVVPQLHDILRMPAIDGQSAEKLACQTRQSTASALQFCAAEGAAQV